MNLALILLKIYPSLSNQIEVYFKQVDKTHIGVEFMFLSYIPKMYKDELLTSFTPSNEEVDNLEVVELDKFVNNKQFALNIHTVFLDIIKEFSHDKLIEFMLAFGRVSLSKKPGKIQSNFIISIKTLYL